MGARIHSRDTRDSARILLLICGSPRIAAVTGVVGLGVMGLGVASLGVVGLLSSCTAIQRDRAAGTAGTTLDGHNTSAQLQVKVQVLSLDEEMQHKLDVTEQKRLTDNELCPTPQTDRLLHGRIPDDGSKLIRFLISSPQPIRLLDVDRALLQAWQQSNKAQKLCLDGIAVVQAIEAEEIVDEKSTGTVGILEATAYGYRVLSSSSPTNAPTTNTSD